MARTDLRRVAADLRVRYPEIVQVGQWLVLTPFCHILFGMLLDGSGDRTIFRTRTVLCPLFMPFEPGSWCYGERCTERCEFSDPNIGRKVLDEFERRLVSLDLPRLAEITGFREYVRETHRAKGGPAFDAYSNAALGRFDEAKRIISDLIGRLRAEAPSHPHLPAYALLNTVLDGPPHLVAEHLRVIERESARSRKLEQHWRPTPFPFEASATSQGG